MYWVLVRDVIPTAMPPKDDGNSLFSGALDAEMVEPPVPPIDKNPRIHPLLSRVYSLEQVGEAALAVHHNEAEGKLGVLCLAPEEGLGIDDPEKRERIGEDAITRFRRFG